MMSPQGTSNDPPTTVALVRRRRKTVLAGLLTIGLVCFMAPAASAQSTIVLNVGGEGSPEIHEEIAQLLVSVVERNPDLELRYHSDLTLEDALGLLGYSVVSPEFMEDLAVTLDAERLLYAVTRAVDGSLQAHVTYFDAWSLETLLDATFPLNTEDELVQMVHQLSSDIANMAVVEFISDRSGVQITVDDTLLGETPVAALDLEPGRHVVTATCEGCETLTRQIEVARGIYLCEEISPLSLSGYVVTDRNGEDREGGAGRNYLIPSVTLGSGVALMGTGLIFGLLTNSTQDDFYAATSYDEAQDLADTGETYALLTNLFLIGGGAVAATGIVLYFVGGGNDQPPQPSDQAGNGPPRASGWIDGGGGGMLLDWPF